MCVPQGISRLRLTYFRITLALRLDSPKYGAAFPIGISAGWMKR